MKMKRIISTALTVIMLFSAVLAVIPVTAAAASSSATVSGESSLTLEQTKEFINSKYLAYDYENAEDMLSDELALGYLDYSTSANGNYTIYINRYTGFVYYVNNITGQILTSNPTDPKSGASTDVERMKIMSQIEVSFFEASNTAKVYDYNSIQWSALYSQISVSEINSGLRVNYTIGDTSTRFLLPGRITAENYFTYILKPMIERYEELFAEAMENAGEADKAFTFFNNSKKYAPFVRYNDGEYDEFVINTNVLLKYVQTDAPAVYNDTAYGVDSNDKQALSALATAIIQMTGKFAVKNPKQYVQADGTIHPVNQGVVDEMIKDYPICETTPIYIFAEDAFNKNITSTLRQYSNIIKQYCPDYTMAMMYEHEKECGFEYVAELKPVIRCALEYTFNEDGSLSVSLPANSVTFDQAMYTLDSLTPLRMFGYGDMSRDGYIFFPDGSGSVLEFSDFYSQDKKVATAVEANIYGQDYCYSKISGKHREQVTMPVYGLVAETNANAITNTKYGVETVKNGFFAVIEEGAALSKIAFKSGGETNKYASVYASYNPYPSDKFNLSSSSSTSGSGGAMKTFTMVSPHKYTGSYTTRIVMLTDNAVGEAEYQKGNFYDSTYSGMAAYYRNYLKENGTLTALELASENIPLYIETLGAMTITSKFLTFPVEKAIPLTTFDDVMTMYNELSKAEETVQNLINKYTELAKENEKNDLLRVEYESKVEKYSALVGQIEDIKNINFRLTGFANGGMHFTYPTKVKWERVCGGKSGFENIIAESGSISEQEGYNFGIYPDFDFLYISNTSTFDGISKKGNASKMIDNRYATKKVYNSVLQDFELFYTLLISSDTLLEHYEKFNKKFSKYNSSGISVSTLGSDINSNFDEKNTVNREDSMNNSVALLSELVNSGYDVMVDGGNVYSAKYAKHILNASTDFSNFRYSSYAVPFVGMILHGYVNYAGAPLNYTGSPDYQFLRALESGAAPYYILCYQNSPYMKDDEVLNQYYGVDYENWYDDILLTYHKLNTNLKDLQLYEIVDHVTLIAERAPEKAETLKNYALLEAEILELLDSQISKAADDAIDSIANDPQNYGKKIKVTVDVDALYNQFLTILVKYDDVIKATADENEITSLKAGIIKIAEKYTSEYPGAENSVLVNFTEIVYESKYSFTTDSFGDVEDGYVKTQYTITNGNVVKVTYRLGDKETYFILNYNIYTVDVKLADGTTVRLESNGYYRSN